MPGSLSMQQLTHWLSTVPGCGSMHPCFAGSAMQHAIHCEYVCQLTTCWSCLESKAISGRIMHAALMYLHNSCQNSCIRANKTHGFGKEMATTAPDAHKRTCKVLL